MSVRYDEFASWWGNHPINQLLDGAGRYRRLATGSALLVLPMTVMGAVLIGAPGMAAFAVSHFVVSFSLAWLAKDLIRAASLVDGRGRPHLSSVALVCGFATLRLGYPDDFDQQFGYQGLFTLGLVLSGAALAMLTAVDQTPYPAAGLAGRLVLVVAIVVLGVAQLSQMVHGYGAQPLYSAGLGAVGFLLIAMALFEARLLGRAVHLAGLGPATRG